MDQALSRTRRNLIGVSVFLTLVSAFGWDSPSEIDILGNTLTANPVVIQILLWIAFGYLIYEYYVHVRPHIKSFREAWRKDFGARHADQILAEMRQTYTRDELIWILVNKTSARSWSAAEIIDVTVSESRYQKWLKQHIEFSMTVSGQESRTEDFRSVETTHEPCGRHLDGRACKQTTGIKRSVVEPSILRGIRDELLTEKAIQAAVKAAHGILNEQQPKDHGKWEKKLRAEIENLTEAIASGALKSSPGIASRLAKAGTRRAGSRAGAQGGEGDALHRRRVQGVGQRPGDELVAGGSEPRARDRSGRCPGRCAAQKAPGRAYRGHGDRKRNPLPDRSQHRGNGSEPRWKRIASFYGSGGRI
jgi:hypothetical protein